MAIPNVPPQFQSMLQNIMDFTRPPTATPKQPQQSNVNPMMDMLQAITGAQERMAELNARFLAPKTATRRTISGNLQSDVDSGKVTEGLDKFYADNAGGPRPFNPNVYAGMGPAPAISQTGAENLMTDLAGPVPTPTPSPTATNLPQIIAPTQLPQQQTPTGTTMVNGMPVPLSLFNQGAQGQQNYNQSRRVQQGFEPRMTDPGFYSNFLSPEQLAQLEQFKNALPRRTF